jgi:hypothetical protein
MEELLKNNKFFNIFDNISEVIKEIINLFDDNIEQNISLSFDKNNYEKLFLKLKFPFLAKRNKDITLELLCKGINDKNINNYLYKEIILLQKSDNLIQKEIEELKRQNEIINSRLFSLENIVEIISQKNNKTNKIDVFFKNQIQNQTPNQTPNELQNQNKQTPGEDKNKIDSKIITNEEHIHFLNDRLLQDKDVPKGKNVVYKLLYRCSKNGEKSKIFHELCDGFPQTLTVIRTTKGKTFGGYTEQTWKDDTQKLGKLKKDNKAFLFSLDNKKIYNICEQPAIWCHDSYGPCFYGKGNFGIYSKEKLVNSIMKTNKAKESTYKGMNKDYELTDGEETFNALEIEVFQILFD